MSSPIRVAILDDHQSIIDGFTYRLSSNPDIEIVGTATYGEEIEHLVSTKTVDVLLLVFQTLRMIPTHFPSFM